MSVAFTYPSRCKFAAATLDEYPSLHITMSSWSKPEIAGFMYPDAGSHAHSVTVDGIHTDPAITPSRTRSMCWRVSTTNAPVATRSRANWAETLTSRFRASSSKSFTVNRSFIRLTRLRLSRSVSDTTNSLRNCNDDEMTLNLTNDELLSTTRSVRKRLDFDRPVEREVVMECLDLALQAPTGSNRQGWQFMFVTDPDKKKAIGDFYQKNFNWYRNSPMSATFADDDPRSKQKDAVTNSAQYLADNFHKAPVLMIPLIEGRLDNASVMQGASSWGSILPAVWSFMLALRSRGLGSAWTTLHLPNERETADILGIPFDQYSQAGLFPIAYTIGTDFKPANRMPTEGIVHWDTW